MYSSHHSIDLKLKTWVFLTFHKPVIMINADVCVHVCTDYMHKLAFFKVDSNTIGRATCWVCVSNKRKRVKCISRRKKELFFFIYLIFLFFYFTLLMKCCFIQANISPGVCRRIQLINVFFNWSRLIKGYEESGLIKWILYYLVFKYYKIGAKSIFFILMFQ